MVTTLQAEVTKTATFNGAAVDISALAAPFEVEITVDSLLAGATAVIELQTSTDSFNSDIRVERALSFGGTAAAITAVAPVSKTLRDFDLPGLRVGVTSAHARVALTHLDAGALMLASPGTVTPTETTGTGTLAAGTYFYEVTALGNGGETLPSAQISATLSAEGEIGLSWAAVAGATSYRVYRGSSSGAENVYFTSSTNSYTDNGTAGTSGAPPTSNSTGSPSVSYSGFLKS